MIFIPLPAFATVTQIEEAPGQMLYQSRQNLRDRTGKSWQVVAFKRVRPDGSEMVSLRQRQNWLVSTQLCQGTNTTILF